MTSNRNPHRASSTSAAALLLLAGTALAQSTLRVSVASSGVQGNDESFTYWSRCTSSDGRYVAFSGRADNLVSGDTNVQSDVFLRDTVSSLTSCVSLNSSGTIGAGPSQRPSISADARYVAFESWAGNLVTGDTNIVRDVFVRDLVAGVTTRVSVDSSGQQGWADSNGAAISATGRFIAFTSSASNLVIGDNNNEADIFVHDRDSDADGIFDEPGAIQTKRVSLSSAGAQPNGPCWGVSISADGQRTAFASWASNLVSGDTNGVPDVFVHDSLTGVTSRVSVDSAGAQANNGGGGSIVSISEDGRWVAFQSDSNNLVVGDTNNRPDTFLHDNLSGATIRVSVDGSGGQADDSSSEGVVSSDGRFVVFCSAATNLVPGDTNGSADVFIRDCQAGTTRIASAGIGGVPANAPVGVASISSGGRFIAFATNATNLVVGDTNGFMDAFLFDLAPPASALDLCQPGVSGNARCPCSNPPANAPRGCDNSAGSGGAQLTSSGSASILFDSLNFATNGERPSATSILLQGNAEVVGGLAFGQGVRCVGGGLKRLYVKTALAGSITAPEPGDPSVSERSATLGDTIAPGTSRWYAVYYRDPIVLGACPSTSTFNITQTQLVTWQP